MFLSFNVYLKNEALFSNINNFSFKLTLLKLEGRGKSLILNSLYFIRNISLSSLNLNFYHFEYILNIYNTFYMN